MHNLFRNMNLVSKLWSRARFSIKRYMKRDIALNLHRTFIIVFNGECQYFRTLTLVPRLVVQSISVFRRKKKHFYFSTNSSRRSIPKYRSRGNEHGIPYIVCRVRFVCLNSFFITYVYLSLEIC